MNGIFHEVQPGDLITADFINEIVSRIELLEEKVRILSESEAEEGVVAITSLIPSGRADDPIRTGGQLEIFGHNFGFSQGVHRVFIGTRRVTTFSPGSSDNHLLVEVPPLPSLPQVGGELTLLVANSDTSDSRDVMVEHPRLELDGNIEVNWLGTTPSEISLEEPVTISYELFADTNLPATFLITPEVPLEGWVELLEVLDEAGNVIELRQIDLDAQQTAVVDVRITSVPSDAPESFTLTLTVEAGDVSGSDSRSFPVGVAVEPPDDTITLNPDVAAFESNDAQATMSGNRVQMRAGFFAILPINTNHTVSGSYSLVIDVLPPTSNWQVTPAGTTTSPYTINVPEGSSVNRTHEIRIESLTAASATGEVEISLQRDGADGKQSIRIRLERIA